jgi:hypothetical protein
MIVPDMLSVESVARKLDCSKERVRRLVATGQLKAVKPPSSHSGRVSDQCRLLIFAESAATYLGRFSVSSRSASQEERIRVELAARGVGPTQSLAGSARARRLSSTA